MHTMLEAFEDLKISCSGHTPDIEISIAAVILGAKVIEKHFALDRKIQWPDHKAFFEPDQLAEMVKSIGNMEVCPGDGKKVPCIYEMADREIVRKSIVAKIGIKEG